MLYSQRFDTHKGPFILFYAPKVSHLYSRHVGLLLRAKKQALFLYIYALFFFSLLQLETRAAGKKHFVLQDQRNL